MNDFLSKLHHFSTNKFSLFSFTVALKLTSDFLKGDLSTNGALKSSRPFKSYWSLPRRNINFSELDNNYFKNNEASENYLLLLNRKFQGSVLQDRPSPHLLIFLQVSSSLLRRSVQIPLNLLHCLIVCLHFVKTYFLFGL